MSTTRSKDLSCLCAFTFSDGRRCTTPRLPGHPHLCCFHARKEAQFLAAQRLGRDVSSLLSRNYISACDLTSALGCVISAVAQGQVKPKTAATLASLGQTLIKSIQVAEHEYCNAFGTEAWRKAVRSCFAPPPAPALPHPAPQSASQPSLPAAQSASSVPK